MFQIHIFINHPFTCFHIFAFFSLFLFYFIFLSRRLVSLSPIHKVGPFMNDAIGPWLISCRSILRKFLFEFTFEIIKHPKLKEDWNWWNFWEKVIVRKFTRKWFEVRFSGTVSRFFCTLINGFGRFLGTDFKSFKL